MVLTNVEIRIFVAIPSKDYFGNGISGGYHPFNDHFECLVRIVQTVVFDVHPFDTTAFICLQFKYHVLEGEFCAKRTSCRQYNKKMNKATYQNSRVYSCETGNRWNPHKRYRIAWSFADALRRLPSSRAQMFECPFYAWKSNLAFSHQLSSKDKNLV